MPQFLTVSEEAHINTIRTAAPLYMKEFSDLTKRNHLLLSMMKSWGNIEHGASDVARIWQVLVRQPSVRTFSDTTNKIFNDHDAFEQLQVGVRGYETTDLLKELQWKQNQGETQLIDLYEFKIKHLASTMLERLQEWFYRDGDDAAFSDGFQGFESALAPENVTTGGTDPNGTTDRVVLPLDSYGGHPTTLANFGGVWSADIDSARRLNVSQGLNNDWPWGQGSSEYDALSPSLFDYSATAWGSGSGKWSDNVEEVVRTMATVLRNKNGMGIGPIDLCLLLAPDLYPEAENYYSSRFRIIQPYTSGDQGFPQAQSMYIDGVALKSDYGCPAGVGYGLCPNHIELFFYRTMNGGGEEGFIDVFGPDWEPSYGAYLMRASVFGNFRLQPKYMAKLATTEHYVAAS
jgi:hypothetical protein